MTTPAQVADSLFDQAYELAALTGYMLDLSMTLRRENRLPNAEELLILFAGDFDVRRQMRETGAKH